MQLHIIQRNLRMTDDHNLLQRISNGRYLARPLYNLTPSSGTIFCSTVLFFFFRFWSERGKPWPLQLLQWPANSSSPTSLLHLSPQLCSPPKASLPLLSDSSLLEDPLPSLSRLFNLKRFVGYL